MDIEHNNKESDLLYRYIKVCNRALDANKDRFPFKQILGAIQDNDKGRVVEVQIIDDHPHADFMIAIEHNKIMAQDRNGSADCNCDASWRVPKSYLEDVVQNPDIYIENPAKIDWEWMYDKA